MNDKLINQWWFWVCIVFITLFGVIFIIAETYAFHPTRIEIYANDEMVNVTRLTFQNQRDINYNDCIFSSKIGNDELGFEQLEACERHYRG